MVPETFFFAAWAFVLVAAIQATGAADRRPLWPDGAPLEKQVEDTESDPRAPTIDHYPASRWTTGAAVIVCPGGGYGGLATAHEGEQVAGWLNEQGVVAFVLRYRHAPYYHYPAPVLDVQRSLRHVRYHAKDYGINPAMIGIMGFSAGGHLAATAATHFDAGDPAAPDPIDRMSCRPDFAILCYPVISFIEPYAHKGSRRNFFDGEPSEELLRRFSNERQVTKESPPTFLFHTDDDAGVVPENSVAFYLALRQAKVSAELHVYRSGPHGGGLFVGDPIVGAWSRQLARWMRGVGLLNWPAEGAWDKSPSLPKSAATEKNP
ncbi:MAG: alpha/beta hydrolase [Planctomycetaceae bacterium]